MPADALKLQTYTADCDNEYLQIHCGLWDGKTIYELYYKEGYTRWELHKDLFDYARKLDLTIFSITI